MAQVYRLAGDEALASGYYRRYLELDPRGRAAPEARRHLGTMGTSLPGGSAAAAWGDAPGAPSPPAPARPPARRRGWMRWAGLAGAGTGVLLLGFGAYYGIEARSISAELSLVDRWTAERLDRFADGERAENRAIGLSIAGGVLVAGGIGLTLFSGRETARPVEVAAALGPSGELSVAAAGRF